MKKFSLFLITALFCLAIFAAPLLARLMRSDDPREFGDIRNAARLQFATVVVEDRAVRHTRVEPALYRLVVLWRAIILC